MLEHTPLIDLEYLVLLAQHGGVVPRAQDIPVSALITPANSWRIKLWGKTRRKYSLGVLVLSYPWLDAWHPDRLGAQIRRLRPILEAMLTEAKMDAPACTVGVFMDWACLPQKPFRDDAEKQRFKLSLDTINGWYFHKATFVLLCTLPPPEVGRGSPPYSNTRLHSQRGWCWFEKAAAMVIENTECLLDLSRYAGALEFGHGGSHAMSTSTCCGQMKSARQPPMPPDQFGTMMRERVTTGELRFTARADMEAVIAQYELGFCVAFDGLGNNGTVMSVGYINLGWGDEQGQVLLEALQYAAEHCRFPFGPVPVLIGQGNFFSADMLTKLPATGIVYFRGVQYGHHDDGARIARREDLAETSVRESVSSELSCDLLPYEVKGDASLRQGLAEVSLRQGVTNMPVPPNFSSASSQQSDSKAETVLFSHGSHGTTLHAHEGHSNMAYASLDGVQGTELRQHAGLGLAFVRIN